MSLSLQFSTHFWYPYSRWYWQLLHGPLLQYYTNPNIISIPKINFILIPFSYNNYYFYSIPILKIISISHFYFSEWKSIISIPISIPINGNNTAADTSTNRRTCRRMEQLLHGCSAADANPTHTPLHPHSSGIRIVLLGIGGGVRSVSQDAVTHATRVSAFGSMRQSVSARSYTCSRIAEVRSC